MKTGRPKKTPEERIREFWAKVDQTGDCWLWTGAIDTNGYGSHYKGRPHPLLVKAHRYAYELHTGEQFDAWTPISHTCSNRHCVRPEHLKRGAAVNPRMYTNRQRGPRPHIWKYGPDPSRKRLHLAFMRSKAQAKFRKEPWEFDFYEFERRWEGRYHETGIRSTCTVMVRKDPRGAWSYANTELRQRGDNQGRMMRIKRNAGLPFSHRFNQEEK